MIVLEQRSEPGFEEQKIRTSRFGSGLLRAFMDESRVVVISCADARRLFGIPPRGSIEIFAEDEQNA